MAENITNKTKGKPVNNKSNTIRSVLFAVVLVFLGAFLISNMSYNKVQKTEVPISEVITRANDPEGDIARIAVTGNTLDITLKGKDQPTETSRKDNSGTLYDQGLVRCGEQSTGLGVSRPSWCSFLSDPAYIPFHHLGATPYSYCKPPHPSLVFTKLDLST